MVVCRCARSLDTIMPPSACSIGQSLSFGSPPHRKDCMSQSDGIPDTCICLQLHHMIRPILVRLYEKEHIQHIDRMDGRRSRLSIDRVGMHASPMRVARKLRTPVVTRESTALDSSSPTTKPKTLAANNAHLTPISRVASKNFKAPDTPGGMVLCRVQLSSRSRARRSPALSETNTFFLSDGASRGAGIRGPSSHRAVASTASNLLHRRSKRHEIVRMVWWVVGRGAHDSRRDGLCWPDFSLSRPGTAVWCFVLGDG